MITSLSAATSRVATPAFLDTAPSSAVLPAPIPTSNHNGEDDSKIIELRCEPSTIKSQRDNLKNELEANRARTKSLSKDIHDMGLQVESMRSQSRMGNDAEEKIAASVKRADQAEASRKAKETELQDMKQQFEEKLQAEQAKAIALLQCKSELQEQIEQERQKYVCSQDNARLRFDQVQDLKGNLRVMCRIRPTARCKGRGSRALDDLGRAEQ